MTAVNLRLSPDLKSDAAAYAKSLGISLNALVAVAVRDYLDARSRIDQDNSRLSVASPQSPVPLSTAVAKPPPVSAAPVPKAGRNDPCPCGSGRKYKLCHGGVR